MRSNVETRRCGCGQLIGLRESCARCASAARARLHEAGVCNAERPRQPYDNGQHQGNATLYKKPPLGKRPHWLDMDSEQLDAARDALGVDCFAQGWGARLKAHQQSQCAHTSLEIAGTCPECGMGWNDAVNQAADRLYKPDSEPPAVGAEVDYATALESR